MGFNKKAGGPLDRQAVYFVGDPASPPLVDDREARRKAAGERDDCSFSGVEFGNKQRI
ncbi:hypothetical protein TVNIR_0744 [Thioalkalivibrio nitratireducens DSM 14787]|uniref:Uncharacterized protein n=1 Tax=Thioalkalivibrio nitratireducens (strain DSM 14787 / UNIQEM 213 / ALEN2) TaxID=1255043 RepID=L0DTU6_THIND|nr:hypothetical protein TVNIR_0744 [Thioalkalivibrio nitratireducens DSM 14787]